MAGQGQHQERRSARVIHARGLRFLRVPNERRHGVVCRTGLIALAVLGFVAIAWAGDVLRDSDVARERMRRLRVGLEIFANKHGGEYPDDLSELYPAYVSDPLCFWHPGDSDPPPTTIDNSVPNAPNSARISFDWFITHRGRQLTLLRDNSPDNNGGLFVNMLFGVYEWVFETDPPLATPTPTAIAVARTHFREIARALSFYQSDFEEHYPDDFIRLWETHDVEWPRMFWNPGDSDPLPTDITNSELDAPNSTQVSFEYLGAGLTSRVDPETILVRDITPDNNGGMGIFVVHANRDTQFIPEAPLGDPDGDCHIDLRDFGLLQTCFTGPREFIDDDTCLLLDWDGIGHVDLEDFARFVDQFTGPVEVIPDCPP